MAAGTVKRIGFGIIPMLGLFVLLLLSLYFMSDATHNSERFGRMYSIMLGINALGLVLLGALVVANIVSLVRQHRQKAVGARMTSRLVIMFVILSVVPVLVVYYFSLQSIQRGIDSWFDVRIERGLDDALDLSRAALDVRLNEVLNLTLRMADEISDAAPTTVPLTLYDLRIRTGAAELSLIGADGRIIASSSAELSQIMPNQPPGEILLLLQNRQHYIGLDPVVEGGLYARALVPVLSARADGEVFTLQALYEVSERISTLADSVQRAYTHYNELAYLRKPLKFSYSLTLSIVLMLSLLAAIWAAFHSARRLVAPVRDLAAATRAVAEGDYSKRLSVASDDELGFLVRSFNDMTRRLTKSRDHANRSKREVEGQRAYLEAVLASLSSGVISLGRDSVIRAINRRASESLGVDLKECLGQDLSKLADEHAFLQPFVDVITRRRGDEDASWREEVILHGTHGRLVLMCRGTALQASGRRGGGMVVVFDDITALIQAQRDAAWGEVARRLAHEIKNPLTPIQLSAERLRHRYMNRMEPEDAEILDRATRTIVNQVEAMKQMVNAFSEYARVPQVNLETMDLHEVVREVLDLYRGDGSAVHVSAQLDAEESIMEGDAGRIRQLLHNLIKNALEAVKDVEDAQVLVATRNEYQADLNLLALCVSDNGPGFDAGVLENVFEPYVSTKPKGSGLGLAIVKKIVEEHGGYISAETAEGGGARVIVRFMLSTKTRSGDNRPA
ncbi:MAG TPA: ATP-binding protein [Gammaproteobacteria bacterium]|jgi:nitrogen fixation/metabolism regulation signal transduction histidine kinase|nr:ATP-binding protein [Gammaproteobacteria bacterium]